MNDDFVLAQNSLLAIHFAESTDDVINCSNLVPIESTSGTMVKTIHVEKEVYTCTDPPAIYDQDIYIKKIEDLAKFPNVTSSTTFEVVTCAKNNLTGDVLGCVKKIPHQYSPINIHCQQTFIGFPMQLNTVVAPNGIVKTVEAQKEVFGCPTSVSPKFMKDVIIFTEIFENVAKHTENSTFDSVVCAKVIGDLNVTGCLDSPTVALPITNQP